MKRVSVNSLHSQPVDEDARVKLRHQSLLQDYLELQKEFVSKKKKVQTTMQKRETLLAEVRFLRRRHKYLLKQQHPKIKTDDVQQHNSDVQLKLSAKQRKYNVTEGVQSNPSTVLDMKQIWSHVENEGGKKQNHVREQVRVQKKPKNCLINNKKAEKQKISVQDQVALKVVSFIT
ncbi:hypothetical protein FEM48_Zijuj06G0067100 [Ziziphus jujuba var. spinosa]|uniref:Uncharacterized protein n=1 Tax=Ziziphus jujuba var. spinosa TaxID=714518 RepID=A0A978V7S2_ZIZJJ|nr:hypothetical protein FEM48_Zijuj06G0067100 [Ziziphus jujuba var. spinosa]